MTTKKYVLRRWYSLVVSFSTPSGVKVVTFGNGNHYHKRNGYFVTSDEELQNAIESSGYFGNEIVLAETIVEKPKEEVVAPSEVSYEDCLADPKTATRETTVTTLQKAKQWLQANHGKSFKGTTKDAIKREAAESYNTIFESWV